MSIATGLIAKLLLAVSVIPAAGYGGYCAYDHYNPTFHNQLIQQGFLFSPISGDMGSSEDFNQRRDEIAKNIGGDWRCSKQLFLDLTPPVADTESSIETEDGSIPSASNNENSSDDNSIGCLVADFGYVTDTSKKAGFLKWELALRSGNRGFIYVGYFSVGESEFTSKVQDHTSTSSSDRTSFSTVFEVSRDSESSTWDIKNGLTWTDFLASPQDSTVRFINDIEKAEISVSLPNGHEWKSKGGICSLNGNNKEKCPDKNQWTFERYVGFWEQGQDGKQVTDAINIEVKEKENGVDKTYKHDIWQTTDFDFSNSNLVFEEDGQQYNSQTKKMESTGTRTKTLAWEQVSKVYEAQENRWKNVTTASAKEYLTKIYSPWAKKKGTWMEAGGVCYESNSRSLRGESSEAKRLLKFCYKQQNKVS